MRGRDIKGRGAGFDPKNRFEEIEVEIDFDHLDEFEPEDEPKPETTYLRDSTKSIITKNTSPDVGFDASINPYRGCLHGCVYCISGDTPILMADGTTRSLEGLRIGDEIYGTAVRGSYRRYAKTEVLAHWKTRKLAYRVTLGDGTSLVASGDHRFLAERGWKFVAGGGDGSRIAVGDCLMGAGASGGVFDGGIVESGDGLRVKKIEALEEMTLYDITTGTGDFIANGVVSHNCFARPNHEYLGFSAGLDFETKIMVKEDAPELLKKELSSPKWRSRTLAMSVATDAYQPVEKKLRLTRRCLEVLAEFRNPVAVITKNHLVTRDIDLLSELAKYDAASVTVSLTTLDDDLRRRMEPRTSSPSRRLAAIEKLTGAGIPVGVMTAPVIPGLTDHELPKLLEAAANAGATSAGYTMLRLPYAVAPLFEDWLSRNFPNRKEKVLNRVRSVRAGKLNDPRFGSRMRGEGVYAEHVAKLFEVSVRRAGIEGRRRPLSASAFRVPGGQPSLFD
ncbi:MAG: PA0069 family radical SAM protein [Rubrobacteraceae bacterium]